jgi:hypothetical protein
MSDEQTSERRLPGRADVPQWSLRNHALYWSFELSAIMPFAHRRVAGLSGLVLLGLRFGGGLAAAFGRELYRGAGADRTVPTGQC